MDTEKNIPLYKEKNFIKQYNKNYYEKNKQRICDMINAHVTCEICGREMSRSNIYNHKKTLRCLKKRKNLMNEEKVHELEKRIKELEDKYVPKQV